MTAFHPSTGSYVSAVAGKNAPSHVRHVQSRRNIGAEDAATCPKCAAKAWMQPTDAGHVLYRCQNPSCGKTWATDCRHARELTYKTGGGDGHGTVYNLWKTPETSRNQT